MADQTASALRLAAAMERKGWSRAFRTESRENVTLISIQQGIHKPLLSDFEVAEFDPQTYEADEETAKTKMKQKFPDLIDLWEMVHEMTKKASTAQPATLAHDLRSAFKEVDETQVESFKAGDDRAIEEFYKECKRLLEMDLKLDMNQPENVNELHLLVKKKMSPGKLRESFTRKWNTWHEKEQEKGINNPWPTKQNVINWIDQSVLHHTTPQDMYQAWLNVEQRKPGLVSYNAYKTEKEKLEQRCAEAGVLLTFGDNHLAAIFQFIAGLHPATRKKLGDICRPDWAKGKTLDEAVEKITTRLLIKERQEMSGTTPETVAYTAENHDGEYWDSVNQYEWYEEEWPEETVAYAGNEWEKSEEPEEDLSWYQDAEINETVAYGYGYQNGYKGGSKGGAKGGSYKGGSYKGSYKGGKGKGKGFHPYGNSGKGTKGGKGKGYKGSYQGTKGGKGESRRCPRCKSAKHFETERCWYSTDYDSSKYGERPAHVDPKDEVLLKMAIERNSKP